MQISSLFYPVVVMDANDLVAFTGTAFPVSPNGGLLTCRHVVDVHVPEDGFLAVFDRATNSFVRIPESPVYSARHDIDLAFLPNVLPGKQEFFPVLPGPDLVIGEDVYTFGFFSVGGRPEDIETGYFSGSVVSFLNIDDPDAAQTLLPFPVLEGLSGSPVLEYHNGVKLAGVATGNKSSRILASEVLDFRDGEREIQETVHRIVEFGVAYHAAAVNRFLLEVGAAGVVVSSGSVTVPGLD